jgi:EmrB/QacA subfamily drug resistance transporter
MLSVAVIDRLRGSCDGLAMSDIAVQAPARERTSLIRSALAASSVALFAVSVGGLGVTTAMPALAQHFDASLQSLEWCVNAYVLGFVVAVLAGSSLGDRFGHRRVLLVGLALFGAASAGCALATTVELLDAARAVQGIGGGLVAASTFTFLRDAFPDARSPVAQGLWWGVSGAGVLLGPLVGGALVTHGNWQWIFWVNVPVALAAIALAAAGLQPTHGPKTKIDVPGLALVAAGLVAIVWGLTRGSEIGWTSKQVVPALGAGALWLAALAVWELAASAPVLPFRALRRRRYLALDAASLAASFALFGALFMLMQFLEVVQGHSAARAGLATVPLVAAALVLMPVAGALCGRIGVRPLVVLGLALQAAALAWFAHVSVVAVAYTRLLPGLVAYGAGIGLSLLPVAYGVLESVRAEAATQACAANVAIRGAGGAGGVAGLTAVLLTSGSYASGAAFTDGLVRALWVGAAVVGGGAVVSLVIPGRRRVPEVVATVLDAPAPVEADEAPAEAPEQLPDVRVGDEAQPQDAIPCPVCLGHGWFAFQPPIDPRTQTCERCYGHGQVLTGSHVPAHMTRACPDCDGRGYVEVTPAVDPPEEPKAVEQPPESRLEIESAPAPAPTATNGPLIETNLPVAEFPRRTTSDLDDLRGRSPTDA